MVLPFLSFRDAHPNSFLPHLHHQSQLIVITCLSTMCANDPALPKFDLGAKGLQANILDFRQHSGSDPLLTDPNLCPSPDSALNNWVSLSRGLIRTHQTRNLRLSHHVWAPCLLLSCLGMTLPRGIRARGRKEERTWLETVGNL